MRDFLTPSLKLLFAAHHFVFRSKDPLDIANVVNTKAEIVEDWMQSYDWLEALGYWSNRPKVGDFNDAEHLWNR